jgi:hypothetical protein
LGGGHRVSECRPFPSENPDSPTQGIEAARPKGGGHGVRGAKGVKGKGVSQFILQLAGIIFYDII